MASVTKPKKGILKTSSSFDAEQAHPPGPKSKEMKWDEMNIMATHHPPDKDYGHMKIDEPPTPYSKYSDPEDDEGGDDEHPEGRRASFGKSSDIDPSSLSSKLENLEEEGKASRIRRVSTEDEESSEDEEDLTEEELEKKRRFEQKRKLHYNEFQAVKLAKQLMEEDDDEDDMEEVPESPKMDGSGKSGKLTQGSPNMQTENPQVSAEGSSETTPAVDCSTSTQQQGGPRETLIN